MRTKQEWEQIYKDKKTPWDMNQAEPILVELIESGAVKTGSALDLGAGTGNEAVYLAQKGFDVTAADISEDAIEEAKKRAKDARVQCEFIAADVLDLKLTKKYDLAFDRGCFHFLEPEERKAYVDLLDQALKPGATFLLIASNKTDPAPGPYQFTKEELEDIFSKTFNIKSIELRTLETHASKPRPFVCLMEKK